MQGQALRLLDLSGVHISAVELRGMDRTKALVLMCLCVCVCLRVCVRACMRVCVRVYAPVCVIPLSLSLLFCLSRPSFRLTKQ